MGTTRQILLFLKDQFLPFLKVKQSLFAYLLLQQLQSKILIINQSTTVFMNVRVLILRAILIVFVLCLNLPAALGQVTIGVSEEANTGAILDLKEEQKSNGGANSIRGLLLPRVDLTDPNALFPMFTGDASYTGAKKKVQDSLHVGLTVYNLNKCMHSGPGVYVWSGTAWRKMGTTNYSLQMSFDSKFIDLPSGKDARVPMIAQPLMATWSLGTLDYKLENEFGDNITFSWSNRLPTSPISGSPFTFNILPNAMNISSSSDPRRSSQSRLVFDMGCGVTDTVRLNQTNYALQVNGSFSNTIILYYKEEILNKEIAVIGNAQWTTSIVNPYGIVSNFRNPIGTLTAKDIKDFPSITTVLNNDKIVFDMHDNATAKYRSADIKFENPNQSAKKFNEIVVSVVNCGGQEPSMPDWVNRAGFPGVSETKVSNLDDQNKKIDTPNAKTSVAWHRDQNDNLFLSAEFGSAGRWMITNLAATDFDPVRDPLFSYNQIQLPFQPSPSTLHGDYLNPRWCYPNVGSSSGGSPLNDDIYKRNPRVGRLYSWAAATNSKGGKTNGQDNIEDGESATLPQYRVIQGICPNGWHLPSDAEWTELENFMLRNSSDYSGLASNVYGSVEEGKMGLRGGSHGTAMKDPCALEKASSWDTNGLSNIIVDGDKHVGFNAILAGQASSGSNSMYSTFGVYWTSSSNGANFGYFRRFRYGDWGVTRESYTKYDLNSVRCKKNQ